MNNETRAILKARLISIPKEIERLSSLLEKSKEEVKNSQSKHDSLSKQIASLKNEREKIKEDVTQTEAKE